MKRPSENGGFFSKTFYKTVKTIVSNFYEKQIIQVMKTLLSQIDLPMKSAYCFTRSLTAFSTCNVVARTAVDKKLPMIFW
jgi:hypothetical protein